MFPIGGRALNGTGWETLPVLTKLRMPIEKEFRS